MEQSRKNELHPLQYLGVETYAKGVFESPSSTVAKFLLLFF